MFYPSFIRQARTTNPLPPQVTKSMAVKVEFVHHSHPDSAARQRMELGMPDRLEDSNGALVSMRRTHTGCEVGGYSRVCLAMGVACKIV